MRTKRAILLILAMLWLGMPSHLHAQPLVSDGGTLTINTATNLTNDLVVGTNGPDTTLEILGPGGAVANINGCIGYDAASTGNLVWVRGNGAVWANNGILLVGKSGSFNNLVITNGGNVQVSNYGDIGSNAGSSNNQLVVTSPGSSWQSSQLQVGNLGSFNSLIIAKGGTVTNIGISGLGRQTGSEHNQAIVTGSHSVWSCGSFLYVGAPYPYHSSFNSLLIADGATVASDGGDIGYGASSNQVVVTGPNSVWNQITGGSGYDLNIGYAGSDNALILTNGGALQSAHSVEIGGVSGSNNMLYVRDGTLSVAARLSVIYGTLQIESGTVIAGTLLATNGSAGRIVFNGGTLTVADATVDNGAPLVVGDGLSSATYAMPGDGLHTFHDGLVVASHAKLTTSAATIGGTVTVQVGGGLDLNNGSPNILILRNSPTLQGQISLQISKPSGTVNDQVRVLAPLIYGGSLVVDKATGTLTTGESFPLFNATGYAGQFTSITLPTLGAGLNWTNKLLQDGSIAVVTNWTGPKISGVARSGTNFFISVVNGVPGGGYTLLSSTNAALPLAGWATNRAGNFDWLGNLSLTNGVFPAELQRFFTVRVP